MATPNSCFTGDDNEETEQYLLLLDRGGSGRVSRLKLDKTGTKLVDHQVNWDVWPQLKDLQDFGAVVFQRCLYIIGGYHTKRMNAIDRVTRLDPMEFEWTECCPMSMPRSRFAVSNFKENIWVTGGLKSDGKSTGSCETYDVKNDTWTKGGMFPSPRIDHACAADDDSIYVSGGSQGNMGQKNIWVYERFKWHELDDDYPHGLVRNLERHAMVKVEETIYFMAGLSCKYVYDSDGVSPKLRKKAEDRMETFKPTVLTADKDGSSDLISAWTREMPRLAHPRHSAGVVTLGHRIYLFGGTGPGSEDSVNEVEYFDMEKQRWFQSFQLPEGDYRNVTCVILTFPKEAVIDFKALEVAQDKQKVAKLSKSFVFW